MLKVMLAYHHFPIYRKAVLEEICNSDLFEVTLVSDVGIHGRDLRVLNQSQLIEIAGKQANFLKVRNITLFGHVVWQSGVIKHVLTADYDVVILLGDFKIMSYWLCLLVCRLRRIRTLLWTHGLLNPDKSLVKKISRESFYELSNGLLLYGDKARNILSGVLNESVKLTVVGNSVDYTRISEVVNLDNDFRDSKKLVYIGRVNSKKRLNLLLRAMELIEFEVCLDIIGSGDDIENLKKIAIERNLNVNILGEITDEKAISEVMNSASVSVVPGDVGLSAIHSLSYGLPVVTHDRFDLHKPEVESLTDSGCGYFYRYEDTQDFADKIVKALDEATGCRTRCIATIEASFTPESQLRRIENAVREVVNVKGRA